MGWLRRRRTPDEATLVTLVGREGCHLCEQAAPVVARVAEATGARWTRVDVDSSPDLLHKYADLVPVVLVDGEQVAHYTVSDKALTSAILRARRSRRR